MGMTIMSEVIEKPDIGYHVAQVRDQARKLANAMKRKNAAVDAVRSATKEVADEMLEMVNRREALQDAVLDGIKIPCEYM
jgi:hypothetical protein